MSIPKLKENPTSEEVDGRLKKSSFKDRSILHRAGSKILYNI